MNNFFDSREEASVAAAQRISDALRNRLEKQEAASLVVSGGTTPARCFEALATQDLPWRDVSILMSDERWVPPSHEDSNEKLIRDTLLSGEAADANLVSYFAEGMTVEERCERLDKEIRFGSFPFACALLGMGEDGHFASLFPDADNLDEGLDLESHDLCLPVMTEASPYARISLSLAALTRSDEIVLLIFGDEKRRIYEEASAGDRRYPVTHLLRQNRAPISIYWAR